MAKQTPLDRILGHRASFGRRSDDEILAIIQSVEPLPDGEELDPIWNDANLHRAELLIALADEVGNRRLVAGIAPIFERAALGDVFEMMQGIRHGAEQAVNPEWHRLTAIMRPLTRHERAGCRRWAVRELGLLRDPSAFHDLNAELDDPEEAVRAEACMSLVMMSKAISATQMATLRRRLESVSREDPSRQVREAADRNLARLDRD